MTQGFLPWFTPRCTALPPCCVVTVLAPFLFVSFPPLYSSSSNDPGQKSPPYVTNLHPPWHLPSKSLDSFSIGLHHSASVGVSAHSLSGFGLHTLGKLKPNDRLIAKSSGLFVSPLPTSQKFWHFKETFLLNMRSFLGFQEITLSWFLVSTSDGCPRHQSTLLFPLSFKCWLSNDLLLVCMFFPSSCSPDGISSIWWLQQI